MSSRRIDTWPGHSTKQTDARLRLAGELKGGDFILGDRIIPAYAARKIVSSIPTNASIEALQRALAAYAPAEKPKYSPPPWKVAS